MREKKTLIAILKMFFVNKKKKLIEMELPSVSFLCS